MTFVLILVVMVVMSLANPEKDKPKVIEIDKEMFRVTPGFTIGSVIILGILAALYTVFW
jgi:solute:Na+ symporter, SSS family